MRKWGSPAFHSFVIVWMIMSFTSSAVESPVSCIAVFCLPASSSRWITRCLIWSCLCWFPSFPLDVLIATIPTFVYVSVWNAFCFPIANAIWLLDAVRYACWDLRYPLSNENNLSSSKGMFCSDSKRLCKVMSVSLLTPWSCLIPLRVVSVTSSRCWNTWSLKSTRPSKIEWS